MLEEFNGSLGDLDEGLPKPSEKLANLFHWTRTKEMQPLLNAVEL